MTGPDPIERRWGWLLTVFRRYVRGFIARHFTALRLAKRNARPAIPQGPLVVVLNHPSWWDPMVGLVLAGRFPERKTVAPIESAALERYRFFERLGFFGLRPGTPEAGRRFVHVARNVLGRSDTAFWITGQGEFTDVRQRPVRLRRGTGMLARLMRNGTVLPLAIEYPPWNERLPEALAHFGDPIRVDDGRQRSVEEWTEHIAQALERTQDELAELARSRDPAQFETLIAGRVGVGGVYDRWRAALARLLGRRFDPAHQAVLDQIPREQST
jgi:1-acyl-sn-glycerol-3-phosphate acyltransferase